MTYIANSFSLQMLSNPGHLHVTEIPEDRFRDLVRKSEARSVIGHPDTARVLGYEYNRESILLDEGDTLFVAQLSGGRLPEGATELPDGFTFRYLMVSVGGV